MKKLISIVAGVAFAAALSLSFASPSLADPAGDAVGAGVVGGVLGFMAGAATADSGAHVHVYDGYGDGRGRDHWDRGYRGYDGGGYSRGGYDGGGYAWRHHVRACLEAFGDRYDPRSDTFVDRYGNRRRCRL
jgi:hypothetical protein